MALGSPLAWSQVGNSAAGAVAITLPFFPTAIYLENNDTTNAYNVNWKTTATAVNDGTANGNIRISAGAKVAFNFDNPNVLNTFVLSLIAVAGTPAFVINAIANR